MSATDEPLYLQLAAVLRERIKQGVYAPGKILPTEPAICQEHGYGRDTIRRALAVLREEGLITTARGTRAIVRPQTTRRTLARQPSELMIGRLPSGQERLQLGLEPGALVLEA